MLTQNANNPRKSFINTYFYLILDWSNSCKQFQISVLIHKNEVRDKLAVLT